MFDGQLEDLCENPPDRLRLISPPYATAEVYGFGKQIRAYGYFPKWLPLCVYTDHSPGDRDVCYAHELASSAPVQLYHSPNRVGRWKALSKKPCYCFYSPSVFYRKTKGIEKAIDAKGTLAFPAHTTPSIDDISDMQIYINKLKKLPEEYQPVSVCLHMVDINKGMHKIFIANGFNVYTAGNIYDERFIPRFYSIIRYFKYSTSNLGGSYLYYSVEMGIPFFLYGDEPSFVNKDDPNIEKGEYTSYKKQDSYQSLVSLFSAITPVITEEQKAFVHRDLGLDDGLGRWQMAAVLYYAFFRWLLGGGAVYISKTMGKKLIKTCFNMFGLEISRQGIKKQKKI